MKFAPLGNFTSVIAAIRKEIQAIDPKVSICDFNILTEQMTQSLMPRRLVAAVVSLFGLLAMCWPASASMG
jgi:hypothetical protein